MINIVVGEFQKLKRYSVLWVGIVAVFFVFALAVFQTSFDSEAIAYEVFADNIIWNNFSLGFPFVIVLTGGYIINREYTDNTLKSVITVPVSQKRLLIGKLIVTGLLTILFAVFSFLCTLFTGAFVLHCESMSMKEISQSLLQICAVALFNFIAVAPLIVWFGRKRDRFFVGTGIAFFYGFCGIFVAGRNLTDFYPITAGLGIIGYAGQEGAVYNPMIGCGVLILMVVLTAAMIAACPSYDKVMAQSKDKRKKQKTQKNNKRGK